MTETDGERTEATEIAGVVDKEALWEASFNSARALGDPAGWALRSMCWLSDEYATIGIPVGSAFPFQTAEETQEGLRALEKSGYFSEIREFPPDEGDYPRGGRGYRLNAAKILSDPPMPDPEPDYPKGRKCYWINFEKIFGCPLVKREKV